MTRRVSDGLLLTGCFVPPAAWFATQQIDYLLKGWICSSGKRWPVPVIAAAALLAIVASAAAPAGTLRGAHPEATRTPGRQFLAIAALLLAAICALGVLAFVVPALVLHPCD
jgi:hypothetical protein